MGHLGGHLLRGCKILSSSVYPVNFQMHSPQQIEPILPYGPEVLAVVGQVHEVGLK